MKWLTNYISRVLDALGSLKMPSAGFLGLGYSKIEQGPHLVCNGILFNLSDWHLH